MTDAIRPAAATSPTLDDRRGYRESAATGRDTSPRERWLGLVCGALAAAIWGVQSVVSRQSVADGLTTADVTILRFGTAALLLLSLALRRMRPFPTGSLGWPRAIALTLLAGAPYSLVLVAGASFAPALHSSVITPGLIPVFTAALGYLFLGERASPARLAGLALVVLGIVAFSWEALGTLGQGDAWLGDLLYVVTAVMWTLFGVLARRWRVNAVDVTVVTCLLSLATLPLIAATMPTNLLHVGLGPIALQAIYQGALVGVGALFLYTQSVALLGAQRAALFVPLVPTITALAGAALLGEWPSAAEIAGMAIVVAGMMLALRADRDA